MFKIQLENKEFYKSNSGRVQHYRSTEKAEAKIKKLGDIAVGAKVVESKARTAAVKTENPEEIVPDIKVVKVNKIKKASTKAKNNEDGTTDASHKAKKQKKTPSND